MGKRFKLPRGPKTLFDKVKDIDPTFIEEVYVLSEDQLKAKLVGMLKEQTDLETAKDSDTDLKQKQEAARVAGETYSVPFKAIKLKRRMIFQVLGERGKA